MTGTVAPPGQPGMDELVRRLHDIVDLRIARLSPAAPPLEVLRGTFVEAVPGTRRAMVRLDGRDSAVPAVVSGSVGGSLVAGDELLVLRRRDGWLVVTDVLGRDAAAGGAHPDLAAHDALGLATDAALAAHAATTHGFASPMTTRGDLIVRDASAPARLAIGAAGRFLRSDGTDPSWQHAGVGWMPYAYPIGWAASDTIGTNSGLIAVSGGNGGAAAQPFLLVAPMALQSVTIRQGATASARSCELRLYVDDGTTTLKEVAGTDGTLSFTPAAGDDRTANVSTPGTVLPPGVYWLVLRNTSTTQTFQWSRYVPTLLAGNGAIQDNTGGIAALGATLDLTTWDTKLATTFAARLNGRVYGQAAAF